MHGLRNAGFFSPGRVAPTFGGLLDETIRRNEVLETNKRVSFLETSTSVRLLRSLF
jgi:hypothetical protein